jgi:hypothetical protein
MIAMSVLPQKADIADTIGMSGLVPKADMEKGLLSGPFSGQSLVGSDEEFTGSGQNFQCLRH